MRVDLYFFIEFFMPRLFWTWLFISNLKKLLFNACSIPIFLFIF